ncbi:MAG: hypothetical protein COT14_03560 [Candidatus Diapherotrites archaeon CG08_land_8_20_14_0_20_30_16]|nr:MAG: hypothetical protein COT14_03560 [Candidatus Diapherotrites archaeon CG08_land_8_20_14_0_20_30_16]
MVFIGDIIAKEEEYLAGKGTVVDEEGNIIASVIGKVKKDPQKKEISVLGKLVLPQVGDSVIGLVTDVKEKVVLVDIQEVKGQDDKKRTLPKTSGVIFIANLSQSYLENPRQAVKIGDLIKAQIIDEDPGAYLLTMKDGALGVLLGLCSKCREKLLEKGKDVKLKDCSVMICSKCKGIETRKLAKDYIYKGEHK